MTADEATETPEPDPIIAALRARRQALGLTGEMVDQLAGFAQGHVAKLENGTKRWGRSATVTTMRRWSEALGMSLSISTSAIPETTALFVRTPEQVRMASVNGYRLHAA